MDNVPVLSLTRRHLLVTALVLVAVLALVGKRLAGAGASQPPRPAAAITPVAAAAPARVVVHVVGAVRRPGLYRLREGARVADAVSSAGGATGRAELSGVNLAAPLVDGAQVVVPLRAAAVAGVAAPQVPGDMPAKVSLAVATLEQLDTLPGIGPVTAQKILDYRTEHGPFRSVDDLDGVPGIGPATIDELRDHVTP
jgi:competence protein ComEA